MKGPCVLWVLCNLQVFVWEDRDEDVVESYKTLEGHRSDILAMTAYAPRQLLASGEDVCVMGTPGAKQQVPYLCAQITTGKHCMHEHSPEMVTTTCPILQRSFVACAHLHRGLSGQDNHMGPAQWRAQVLGHLQVCWHKRAHEHMTPSCYDNRRVKARGSYMAQILCRKLSALS